MEGSNDKIIPFAITCSNNEIKSSILAMRKKNYAGKILDKSKQDKRKTKQGRKPVTAEELDEEEEVVVDEEGNVVKTEAIERVKPVLEVLEDDAVEEDDDEEDDDEEDETEEEDSDDDDN